MTNIDDLLVCFAARLTSDTLVRLAIDRVDCDANRQHAEASVQPGGKKYRKVDQPSGHGRFLVEIETGIIYGIKGYGKVHKGHVYGTLDTIDDWDWGGYHPRRKGDR